MPNPQKESSPRSLSFSDPSSPRERLRSRAESKYRRPTMVDPLRSRSSTSPMDNRMLSAESKTSTIRKKRGLERIFGKGGSLAPSNWLVFSESATQEFQWDFSYHYFLGLLGCTISLNDLVKFPERCIKYGGVWFLAIHIFFTIVFAFPFFVVENLLGQSSGATAMQAVNNICPILGGFGFAIMVTRMIELVELSTWLCWAWIYLFASFTPDLPWSICGNQWNNLTCFTHGQQKICAEKGKIFWNLTCAVPTDYCSHYFYNKAVNHTHCMNGSNIVSVRDIALRSSPGNQFMLYVTENPILFDDVSDAYIFITYTMIWVLYYLCIWNGMKSAVNVTHLTMTYTFLALLILVATTMLSEGGLTGVGKHMFQNIHVLGQGIAWTEALRSALDTLSLGLAINFMYAKFNLYSYNFMRPLVWVVVLDVTFCILFSFTVAAFLGMAAKKDEHGDEEFTTEGIPLLLDSVPRIFQYLPSPNIFCGIFYLFCISISLEIGFVLLETILISLISIIPKIRRFKQYARMGLCFSQWCVGMFFFTQPGLHVINSVKSLNAMDSDFLFAIEAILITWVYGFCSSKKMKHFVDFQDMLGYVPTYHYYLKVGFYVTAPLCALFYVISRWTSFEWPEDDKWWAWIIYYFVLIRSPCILIIFGGLKVKEFRKKHKPLWKLVIPEQDWVPED